eukprot:1200062-Karenia_brevis.AAC.1
MTRRMRSGSVWSQFHQGHAQEGPAARCYQFQCGHLSLFEVCAVAACGANAIKETRRKDLPLDVINFSVAISACEKDAQWQRVAPVPSRRRAGRTAARH